MKMRVHSILTIAITPLLINMILTGCGVQSSSTTTQPPLTPWGLSATNEAGLTAYFRDALGQSSKNLYYTRDLLMMATAEVLSAAPPGSGAATTQYSGTTLQEIGVDEADLIKSDGNFVYSLDPASSVATARNILRRQRLDGASNSAPLIQIENFQLPFSANVSGSGLFLDSARQKIVAVGKGNSGWQIYDLWFDSPSWGQGITEVVMLDTANAQNMQTIRTLNMTGHLIGSRRINSTLYLVLRSYPQVTGIDPWWPANKVTSNQTVVDSLQAAQLLPTLSIDGEAAQPLVQASSCFTQEQNAVKSADIITIVSVDLAATAHRHQAVCFTGGTEAFYMSEQSLYLATTRTAYAYSGTFPVYAQTTSTDIHKFTLNDLDIAYRGSGNITGHLGFDQNRKSFRMSEYANTLRVITQTLSNRGGWVGLPVMISATDNSVSSASGISATAISDSPGHLSVLQEVSGALQVVGELPNAARPQSLGKSGEQLYASRFIGNRGYLVTYRLTDPLYVLDLSDPKDPKVAGELQVDGYSDYLFPLNANLLLGVGKDAKSDGSAGDGRFAWYQGVKVALIDVTNPAAPTEAARTIIGKRGTDATVLHDHHGIAIQTLGNTVRISLPVSLHETASQWNTGSTNDYFDFTRSELQRFEVDLATKSLTAVSAVISAQPSWRDISNDRSLLWNDQLHWYQNGIWSSAAW
jgi:uncharacterized secreted protein with C-terminal beta-propeller domain